MSSGTKNNKSTLLSIRIPNALNDALASRASQEGISKAKVVVEGLRKELGFNCEGKRKSGRPRKTYRKGGQTKVIRVEKGMPSSSELEDLIEKLRDWQEVSQESSQTSPRWEKLRELLEEISSIVDLDASD